MSNTIQIKRGYTPELVCVIKEEELPVYQAAVHKFNTLVGRQVLYLSKDNVYILDTNENSEEFILLKPNGESQPLDDFYTILEVFKTIQ